MFEMKLCKTVGAYALLTPGTICFVQKGVPFVSAAMGVLDWF